MECGMIALARLLSICYAQTALQIVGSIQERLTSALMCGSLFGTALDYSFIKPWVTTDIMHLNIIVIIIVVIICANVKNKRDDVQNSNDIGNLY
jgi:hypothetical protein